MSCFRCFAKIISRVSQKSFCGSWKSPVRNQKLSADLPATGCGSIIRIFEKLPVAIQRRVLQSQLEKFGLLSDFDLIESLRQAPGIGVNINATYFITRDLDGVLNLHRHLPSSGFNQDELAVNLAGRAGEVRFGNVILKWRFDTGRKFVRARMKSACELFDATEVGKENYFAALATGRTVSTNWIDDPGQASRLVHQRKNSP